MSERTHAAGPATAVVLRWLRENTESTRIRSPVADQSDLMHLPGSRARTDETDSHLAELMLQARASLPLTSTVLWYAVTGACAATPESSESFTAFKNTCLSFAVPVMAGIIC